MTSLMASLGIDRLSNAERLQLVEEILEELSDDRELPPLTESQRQELDRRLAALEGNPSKGSTWEEVEARVSTRLPRNP